MPSRAASHTGSLINRTIESGGSIGGNSKAGVIHTSSYPNINMGYLRNRVDTGCCSYHYNDYDSDAVPNNTPPGPNSTPTDTTTAAEAAAAAAADAAADAAAAAAAAGPSWGNNSSTSSTSIDTTNGGTITTDSNTISFQGNTLP